MRAHTGRGPSIIEVAAAAGVSTATAGRALGGYGQVKAATLKLVRDAADRLGYKPNGLARSLINGTSLTIGVVVTDAGNPFFAQAVRGIADTVRAAGYEVLLFNTDSDLEAEQRAVRVLWEKRVDGAVIATGSPSDTAHLDSLGSGRLPCVLLDRPVPARSDIDTVAIANVSSARKAVRHLLNLGHRRIAVITEAARELPQIMRDLDQSRTMRPSSARLAGYVSALRSARLEPDPDLVVYSPYEREQATRAIRKLLDSVPDVTAIFATDNVLSIGAYRAIQTSGLRFPEQISMIGFDDQDWTTIVRPELTVVRQPSYEVGVRAGELLLKRIAEAAEPPGNEDRNGPQEPQHLQLAAKLIKRASTAPPDNH